MHLIRGGVNLIDSIFSYWYIFKLAYFKSILDLMKQELINTIKVWVQRLSSLGGVWELQSKVAYPSPRFSHPADRISMETMSHAHRLAQDSIGHHSRQSRPSTNGSGVKKSHHLSSNYYMSDSELNALQRKISFIPSIFKDGGTWNR